MKIFDTIKLMLLVMVTAIITGCSNSDGRVTSEGQITYRLECPKTWEHNKKNDNLLSLFPQNIDLYFKDNNTSLNINGYFFKIKYLSRYDLGRNYTCLSIALDNMMNEQDSSQSAFGYQDMENLTYTYTNDTMTVAGYLCKKAVVYCPKKDMSVDVWYTNNIKIKNANSNNAFKQLNGVPMKFDIILMDFYMKFEAVNVKYDELADNIFSVPEGFKKGSKQDLMEFMQYYMRNN